LKLIHGDSLEVLKGFPENSIDACVTDPPAGISFMSKSWDDDKGGRDQWIEWLASVMREVNRVLKPGAHALVWAIPRTAHWTGFALEDAGFEVRDCITHLFGSGFPKSMNVSIAIDKQKGLMGSRGKAFVTAGRGDRADIQDQNGKEMPVHDGISPEAKQWQGWGTALKPAAEFWWLCRKPLSEDTVAKNVLKWGTGALNIDGCRIEATNRRSPLGADGFVHRTTGNAYGEHKKTEGFDLNQGRFPANLILSHSEHCTDDACDLFSCPVKQLDEQAGDASFNPSKVFGKSSGGNIYANGEGIPSGADVYGYGDKGGPSRFFYCAKVSSRERNQGCEGLDERAASVGDTRPSGSMNERIHGKENRSEVYAKNNHPTVKPIKLMSYLCRLITPPNGVILDPFMGSGSTGMAAIQEGFDFIGIEREKEYFEIAEKRIASCLSDSHGLSFVNTNEVSHGV